MRLLPALLWLLLFAAVAGSVGGAELRLAFDRPVVEWGKPLRGHVEYRGPADAGAFDLGAWEADFHVDRAYAEVGEDETGGVLRREAVRLYPRSVGRQQVPALRYGGARSEPLVIDVLAPQPERGTLALDYRVSAERVSAGEQLRVQLRLVTTDERIRVALDDMRQPGVTAQPLALQRRVLPEGGIEHRLGWSLHFAAAGMQRVALPPLRYILFGRDLYRFHLPLLSVQVDALPAYVPLTVPVGELELHSALAQRHGQAGWQVAVVTDGQLPVGLPELESQLAALSGVSPEALHRAQRQELRADGVYTVLEYHAPLPRWLLGLGAGPALEVQVFDPVSRRIQRQVHRLPAAWRAPLWFGLTLGALALLPGSLLARRAWRNGRRRLARRALLDTVARAADPDTLRHVLLRESGCRSLGEWVARRGDARAAAAAAALNAACFGRRTDVDLQALRRELAAVIRRGVAS